MTIWVVFHLTICFLTCFCALCKNKKYRVVAITLICITLVYFSTFRNGLGSDYEQYIKRISYYSTITNLSIIYEPLFNVIGYIIDKTRFSYLLLFLISAIATNVGIVLFCEREKKYFPYMILLFVFYPVLYMQSFNLIRQFYAIGLFYYSLRYIGVSLWKYILCVTLAALMHFSAFLLIPLYWILNRKYRKYWIMIAVIVFVLFIPSILNSVGQYNRYEAFILSSSTMYSSGLTILYNVLLIIIISYNRLYKTISPIYLNLLILLVVFIDASYINYGFYRFALYFIPIVIYIIPFIIDKLWDRKSTSFVIIILILHFYINSSSSLSNKALLPFSALFD